MKATVLTGLASMREWRAVGVHRRDVCNPRAQAFAGDVLQRFRFTIVPGTR